MGFIEGSIKDLRIEERKVQMQMGNTTSPGSNLLGYGWVIISYQWGRLFT